MLYHGFISYSHAADGKLAPALQRALHTLAKPWYLPRALRIFRDKTSLSANPALWPAIEQALGESAWFLFMASPQAVQSPWVRKEIEWWIANRGAKTILIVLTDGELIWDTQARDFDWKRTTAIPDSLRGCFEDEPLYVDLRWAKSEENLSLRHLQFRGAVLTLAAPLHGKAMDELDGEDVQQLRRNKTWAWSAVGALSVLLAVSVLATINAVAQRDEAVRQRDLAQGRQLRAEAQRVGETDDQWALGMLLAIEAFRRAPDADSYEQLWKLSEMGAKPVGRFFVKDVSGPPLAFSPDGELVATGDREEIVVFRARGADEVKRIPFPKLLRFIAFSRTADQVVAADDTSVRVFDFASRKELARHDEGMPEPRFGFSDDGQILAVVSGTRAKVVEVFTGRILGGFDLPAPVRKVVVSPGGKRLALISENSAWLLDTASGQTAALPERPAPIRSVAFSGDDTLVASTEKNDVFLLDAATGEEPYKPPSGPIAAWFSPFRKFLLTRSLAGDPTLVVHDVAGRVHLDRIPLRDSVRVVDWSEGGQVVAVGTGERDGSTSVFRVGSWRRLARLKHQGSVAVEAVAISPNGDLVASRANRTITVFETGQGAALARFRNIGRSPLVAVGGKTIAGLVDKNTVLAFAVGSDRQLARLDNCSSFALSLSEDGGRLAAGCGDGEARIIDVRNNKVIGKVPHRANERDLAISPDGTKVFAIGPRLATIFDTDGHEIRVLGGDAIAALAFDRASKQVAVSRMGTRVFEVSGSQPSKKFDEKQLIESVAFSPDGKRLALGARNRFVNVHDIEANRPVAALDHMQEETKVLRVSAIAFSGDGRLLASVALDPTVTWEGGATLRVFSIDDERQLIRVPLPEVPLHIGFSADHAFLEAVVGEEDIRLVRFPIHSQDLIEQACALMGRNLSEDEWNRYLHDAPPRKTCAKLNAAAARIK
jgi:WD40 repeat protein